MLLLLLYYLDSAFRQAVCLGVNIQSIREIRLEVTLLQYLGRPN